MPITAAQKLGMLCLPVAAVGLAVMTADPGWNPPRTRWGSLQAKMEAQAAAKAAKAAPAGAGESPTPKSEGAPEDRGASPPREGPTPPEHPGKKEAGGGGIQPPGPKEEAKKGPRPAGKGTPALPSPPEIEFRVSGLGPCRSSVPLSTAAADRLDIHVTADAALRVNANFADPDTANEAMKNADPRLKSSGLLFVVPNIRSPWDSVKDVLVRGAAAGWTRVGLAVSFADNPGQGRVLPLTFPSNDAPDIPKGLDPITVKVTPGPGASFVINGEECKDAPTLETKAKALHEDYELMTEGYSKDVEKTPWVVDGTGAMAGGVIAALDALAGAGVKVARIAGVRKPVAGAPEPEKPAPPEKPAEEEKK